MPDKPTCPTCGAALASDAMGGACPKCLLQAGFATGSDGTPPLPGGQVPTPQDLAPKFPGLIIEELLGRGGMGVVYRARHKALDRAVALKILPAHAASDRAFADRFQREARALAKLQHPNIVAVHDFGETEGLFWLVMEYVDGLNIRQAMRAGQIGPKEALAIVPQICDALQYAHEHGVVHRDIKPENVLLDTAGRVKVADFGLAKLTGQDAGDPTLTGAGQVMGTMHYMAPEQWEHPKDVDHRADIYSLGVVFYEMLTGELPLGRFEAPSARVQVDVRLDEVVLRSLAKAPDRRYQHVSEVKTDVGLIARSPAAPVAVAPRAPESPAPPARLSRLAVAGALGTPAAVVLVALVAAVTAKAGLGIGIVELVLLGGLVVVVGWAASIAAWVRISSSPERLRGKGWAMTGTFLPLVASCILGPLSLAVTGRATGRMADLEHRNAQTQAEQIELMNRVQVQERSAKLFTLESTFPEIVGNEETAAIAALWTRSLEAIRYADPEPTLDLYLPEDRDSLRKLVSAARNARVADAAHGLPIYALSAGRDTIAKYGPMAASVVDIVEVGGGVRIARVSMYVTDGRSRFHFHLRGRITDDATGRHISWFFDNGHVDWLP